MSVTNLGDAYQAVLQQCELLARIANRPSPDMELIRSRIHHVQRAVIRVRELERCDPAECVDLGAVAAPLCEDDRLRLADTDDLTVIAQAQPPHSLQEIADAHQPIRDWATDISAREPL